MTKISQKEHIPNLKIASKKTGLSRIEQDWARLSRIEQDWAGLSWKTYQTWTYFNNKKKQYELNRTDWKEKWNGIFSRREQKRNEIRST